MIGAEPPPLVHRPSRAGGVALAVRGLSLPSRSPFGVDLVDVGLELHAGEVLGVAGVSGNGQQELLAALSGEDARAPAGAIVLRGEPAGDASPRRRRELGLHFVPEERLGRGAVPSLSLAQNLLLTRRESVRRGWIARGALAAQAASIIERFRVKAGGPGSAARSLSGGNLQKFIVGREIDADPKVLLVAQPTWGVDVGAAAQIRAALLALRDAGCAVLVVSEELDELFELSDRLVVIAGGRLSPPVARSDATVERIGVWMSGLWPGGPTDRASGAAAAAEAAA
jgi:simple sugar transport system ATP-binding protein